MMLVLYKYNQLAVNVKYIIIIVLQFPIAMTAP